MKVVKKGRPQKGWAKEFTCTGKGNGDGGCSAKLLVERDDLFHTYASYMGRDEEWFVTFRCSACGSLTDITGRDAPPHIRASELPHYRKWCEAHGIAVPK
ncbi:MAG: hypothetical protein Q7S02_03975 [bacterium]|nr:hypothetical protein [bacterium]